MEHKKAIIFIDLAKGDGSVMAARAHSGDSSHDEGIMFCIEDLSLAKVVNRTNNVWVDCSVRVRDSFLGMLSYKADNIKSISYV
jgi:hypothetical protein